MKTFNWSLLKHKIWYCAVITLLSAFVCLSSASAGPEHLAIQMQQTTANPVLTRATVNYRVMVLNTGTVVQQNVQVRVSFPGSRWGIPANGVGTNCAFAGGGGAPTASVTCMAGTLAGGATKTIAFQIIAPSRVINHRSQQFTITAGLDVNGALPGTGGADATATVATEVQALPDLDPQWSGPLSITAGEDAAYTLRLRNTGDGMATGVFARITLPREVDFMRLEQSTFRTCPKTGQEINCSDLVIQPGSEASVRIIVRPLQLITDGTKVLLSVGADPSGSVRESRENNNTSFIITTVRSRAELAVGGTFSFKDSYESPPNTCGTGIPSGARHMVANLKIKNWGPGVSPATTVRVDWLGSNLSAVSSLNDCVSAQCCVGGSCVQRSGGCPSDFTRNFNSASVPSLYPFAEIAITVEAVTDVPGFNQNQVEFGSVTLDPNNLVNDSNRQNNRWTMRP